MKRIGFLMLLAFLLFVVGCGEKIPVGYVAKTIPTYDSLIVSGSNFNGDLSDLILLETGPMAIFIYSDVTPNTIVIMVFNIPLWWEQNAVFSENDITVETSQIGGPNILTMKNVFEHFFDEQTIKKIKNEKDAGEIDIIINNQIKNEKIPMELISVEIRYLD